MKYNKALDRMAMAAAEFLKNGHTEKGAALAARLFASAMAEPSAQDAINIIEASNRQAYAQLQAAAKKTTAAKSRLQAEEVCEEPVAELPMDDAGEEIVGDFEADPILEVEDEVEPEPMIPAKTMASVLSKMVKNGSKAK